LLPAIQAAREAARRAQCQSQLHNLAIAVLNYESAKKILPNGMSFAKSAANPNVPTSGNIQDLTNFGPNWIIEILPYMEEQGLRDSFDPRSLVAPYNPDIGTFLASSPNVKARGTEISSLLCPSDPFNRVKYAGLNGNWARCNYAANSGREFLYSSFANTNYGWQDSVPPTKAAACTRGVMGPNTAVKLKRISDGTSKTIMIGEIRAGITENDARGCWAMGHAGASLIAMFGGGSDANGPNCAFSNSDDVRTDTADSSGVCVARTNPLGIAENMSAGGGNGFDQATVRSKHPGGAHLAMADGSVMFINDDIETTGCYNTSQSCCTPWDWMITSADGGKGGAYNGGAGNDCK
jgi:prepilin-type processing-associated H-X9-DG protein